MVYDYIYFHDELDLLDARLHELNDVVDKFIIVEHPEIYNQYFKRGMNA